ncbi:MAG: hypothetical protein AABW82_00530 [Nanoarchaeota archaeon]
MKLSIFIQDWDDIANNVKEKLEKRFEKIHELHFHKGILDGVKHPDLPNGHQVYLFHTGWVHQPLRAIPLLRENNPESLIILREHYHPQGYDNFVDGILIGRGYRGIKKMMIAKFGGKK